MWKSTSSSAFAGTVESPCIAAAAYTDSSSSEISKAGARSRGLKGKQARGVCGFDIVEGFQSESKSRQAEGDAVCFCGVELCATAARR